MSATPDEAPRALGLEGALDATDIALYESVLDQRSGTAEELAAPLGLEPQDAEKRLVALRGLGLVARGAGPDGRFAAVDPRSGLRALSERIAAEAERVRSSIPGMVQRFEAAGREQDAAPQTRIVQGADDVAAWYARIQNEARGEFLAFDRPPYVSAAASPLEVDLLGRGVEWRAIYTAASLEADGVIDEVRELVGRGEQARLTDDLPVKLVVADRRIALLSLSLEADRAEALVTEAPPLVAMLVAFFEDRWARAAPITPAATGHPRSVSSPAAPTADDLALLAFFSAGMKDESIARQLGVSTRTVRRRSQDLLLALGAANRFQAGAEAARRGWV